MTAKRLEYMRQWQAQAYKNNPEKYRLIQKKNRLANPELFLARTVAWQKANPEKANAKAKRYRSAHPDRVNAKTARRRASKASATPAWATAFLIDEAYGLARLRTRLSGLSWHVDHIVPLRSKFVCGLHVESNLRVIPAISNARKSNRLLAWM